jgi:uncharacterized protein YbbC (DUF1343 family)
MSILAAENKKRLLFAIILLASIATADSAVELGVDVLAQSNYALLRGKRVGLITNQTGVDSDGTKTRVLLHKHCNLVALYTPEHGLDGTEKAGRYVKSRRDKLTGLTAYSLYGPTRKPTPSMLRGVDVLVFDIQDVGCRSYTYISTMGKCMEAAAENNIDFIVLDRPNPLGGLRMEGPSVEPRWISFVSAFPVPYVHGMTVGELAKMANARGWIRGQCNLTVVPMRGWSRTFTWRDTGLRWFPTSPNIPHGVSAFYYVATGLVGELSGPETGIGGYAPFEVISASWLKAESFTRYLQSLDMPGVTFQEFRRGRQQGSSLSISPNAPANLTALGIYMLAELNRSSGTNLFRRTSRSKLDIFFKCYGSSSIRAQLERGTSPARIVASWQSNVANFRSARAPYLLY